MKLWCTGESGFLARNLSDWCDTHSHHQVINRLDDPYYDYWRSNILGSKKEINIFDPTLPKLVAESGVDMIIHAASVEYDDSRINPNLAIHTNIEGTYNVATIAKKLGIPVIYISSIGKNTNLYSTTKYSGEQIIRHATNDFVVVKPAVVYGKYDRHSSIAKVLESIKGGSSTFPLDIDSTRSYVYVDDFMSAIDIVFDNINKMIGDTVEIGNDALTFENIFDYINSKMNICPDCTFLQVEDLMGDIVADSTYIKSLGWTPKTSLWDGIKKTIEHYNL